MSATVNKLVYGDLTFTDDEIQDGEVYDAVALLSDALEIGTINVGLYIRDEETGAALTAFRRNEKLLYYYRDKLRGTFHQRDRGPCDQCGLCAAGQPLPGTEELPGPRPGTGGRSAKKSRPPRSARTLLTTAREWLDSQADEEYGYEDDGDY